MDVGSHFVAPFPEAYDGVLEAGDHDSQDVSSYVSILSRSEPFQDDRIYSSSNGRTGSVHRQNLMTSLKFSAGACRRSIDKQKPLDDPSTLPPEHDCHLLSQRAKKRIPAVTDENS
jgi:hypothetical protein